LNKIVQIFSFSFSPEGNCLCIGTNKGFNIYQTNGFKLRYQSDIGGVSFCEILGNTNIVALVGAGESPEFSQKRLILFDMKKEKKVCDILYEEEKILNVKLSFSILTVSTCSTCYIYNFPKVKLTRTIPSYNPQGIIALTSNIDFNYFAYVNRTVPREHSIEDTIILSYVPDLLEAKENENTIWTSQSDISLVSFNYTGNLMAVACNQGKFITIMKVPSLTKLITLHRGMDATKIYQLSFSKESNYILNTSAKGTLHIYDISSVVGSEHDHASDLTGNFNFSKVAHNLYQGARHLITGKSEDVNCSIIQYKYTTKNSKKFIGIFTNSNKLLYLIDEEGQFTELRIGENQIISDSVFAEEVLKRSFIF